MKVRLACVDDLNEIMELYHLVSDMMEDSAYDIGWRKDVYPTKENCSFRYRTTNTLRFRKK